MTDGIGRLGRTELTLLLAMATALTALGIDLMLPAFTDIRSDLGLPAGSPATGGLVTTYFFGLALGQVVYGPVSDRFGRRPALYAGFTIYALGAATAALAPTFGWLLAARFLWGAGAAGSRVIVFAVVRDVYDGDRMARAMSSIMAVFILVPVIAPSIGALVTGLTTWRWLFAGCVAFVGAVALWAMRLPETLAPAHRLALRPGRIATAAGVVVGNRITLGYALGLTALFGGFVGWLGSAELIFGETFSQPRLFPLLFGVSAGAMGISAFTSGRIVERIGARRLAHRMLAAYLAIAAFMVVTAVTTAGRPPLWLFLLGMIPLLCSHALLIPNANTIAMQPMAAVAGTASALIGATQIAGGAALGSLLNRAFDGTVLPLSVGFLALGLVASACIAWAERGVLFGAAPGPTRPIDPAAVGPEPT